MRNAFLIAAACLITVGVAFVAWPAGLMTAGVLLGAFVLLTEE